MTPKAVARLVRLPNLPTALADVALAALAVSATTERGLAFVFERWAAVLLLALASACLYLGGMVFNDYFDAEEDRRERADRPIPAGEVSPKAAFRLGVALLVAGVAFALLAGLLTFSLGQSSSWLWPPCVAVVLVGAILAYDGGMKLTLMGPLFMGACRTLNVMLGASIEGGPSWLAVHLGCVVGLYVVGLTWFARTESRLSARGMLLSGAGVMACALLLSLSLPEHLVNRTPSPLFVYLLVGLGFFVGIPLYRAIEDPSPSRVQAGVTRALMGLILLDAVLATATVGTVGLVIAALMLPSLYLNRRRWLYAT